MSAAKRVIHDTRAATQFDSTSRGRKVGILLRASADGLTAVGRTFWADAAGDEYAEVTLSPLETHFHLRGEFADSKHTQDVLSAGFGSRSRGTVRSRTVCLAFTRRTDQEARV